MLDWILQKIYHNYTADEDNTLETGWVYAITFFLTLFLLQTLVIWLFGAVGSVIAWIILVLISAGIAYVLIYKDKRVLNRVRFFRRTFDEDPVDDLAELKDIPEVKRLKMKPMDEPVPHAEPEKERISVLEKQAHESGALLSYDALRYIADLGGSASHILEQLIIRARKIHPRFDGWVALNKGQVLELLRDDVDGLEEIMRSYEDESEEEAKEKETSHVPNIPLNLPTGALQSKNTTSISGFLQHLCEGDEEALLSFMRGLRQGSEEDIRNFMREVVLVLDAVHEHRVEGTGYIDKEILEQTRCFSNQEIEELIAILIGSIDNRYEVPAIGIKLSILRVIEYIRKARSN